MPLMQRLVAWLMPRPAKAWPLENQIQAQALSLILQEEGIPHRIRRNGGALWGFAEEVQEGWGQLEADEEFHPKVEELYQAFLVSEAGQPEESET